jgi:hypothetical protein
MLVMAGISTFGRSTVWSIVVSCPAADLFDRVDALPGISGFPT